MRVLIANGDERFLGVAQQYLSDHGHEVNIATNGLESVLCCAGVPPTSSCSIESCSGGVAMVFGLACCRFPGGQTFQWFLLPTS
jgi:hypothetical protein